MLIIKLMKFNLSKLTLFLILLMNLEIHAQELFHEVSIGVGPVSFRGDYGEREDNETNLGNTGFGISLVHFLNFAYSPNSSTYFNEHFKLRTQVLYQNSNLEHFGTYAEGTGEGAIKLRAMKGEINSFEIGTGLQWYYKGIRDYERSLDTFSPYAGLGIGGNFSSPSHESTLGPLGSTSTTFKTFLPDPSSGEKDPISNGSETSLALNFQVGTQYRLTQNSDLFIELRWHLYSSDFVDGLSPIGDQNESDDWSAWLSLGYVYYFDSF